MKRTLTSHLFYLQVYTVNRHGEIKLPAMDQTLELLRNGKWYRLKEIAEITRLHEFKVELVASFLAEYDLLEFDKKEKRIRLSPQSLLFLKKIENIEKEEIKKRSFIFSY